MVGILVLVAPLLFLACSSATAPLVTRWEGVLSPVLPHTVGGRIAAVTQFGSTQVSVQIEDGEPEATYAWKVNAGSCQEAGELQGGVASYPTLLTSPGGSATAATTLSELFRTGDEFAFRVFLSTETAEEEVACGELEQVG
jgi:hypothetical protein